MQRGGKGDGRACELEVDVSRILCIQCCELLSRRTCCCDNVNITMHCAHHTTLLRGGDGSVRITLQNCTSLMAHWQTVLRNPSDIVVLLETCVTQRQQDALDRKARACSLRFLWGKPLPQCEDPGRNGLLGKSGGVALLGGGDWSAKAVDLGLELEALLAPSKRTAAKCTIKTYSFYLF